MHIYFDLFINSFKNYNKKIIYKYISNIKLLLIIVFCFVF